jgi:hypothetical protein
LKGRARRAGGAAGYATGIAAFDANVGIHDRSQKC